MVHGETIGVVEVFYLVNKPENDEGPFLKEERSLINAIAERLGSIIERKRLEETLRKAHDELERRVEERTSELVIANEQLLREIEEHKKTKEASERLERRFEELVEGIDAIVWEADAQTFQFNFVSKRAETLLKYPIKQWLEYPQFWVDHIHPDDRDEAVSFCQQATKEGKNHEFEYRMIAADGSVVWLRDVVTVETLDGVPICLKGIMVDISRRKLAEEEIRKSKSMLQRVFDGISDPLILLDENLSVKIFNMAASEYYQVEHQDIIDKPCFEAFMGGSSPCVGCNIPSAVLNGQHVSFERKGIKTIDKVEQVVVYPLREKDIKEGSAIIRISDITESRRIQRQLMQSEKLASLGFLISGVAHETNNPNNFITFNLPILRDYLQELIPIIDDYAEEHKDFDLFGMSYPEFRKDIFKLLDNMEHGSRRINTTVNNLMEFYRMKDRLEEDWIDIAQVIEKGASICRGKINRMIKSFEVNIPENLPLIYVDPQILEQVLVNLLINAGQAADKEDSWVRLSIALGNTWKDYLIIDVSDNGCGMDEKTKEKIFDPFYTTKAPGEGTGVGLSLCHNLIEALGGRIEVESEPGIGSTFRVILTNKNRRRMRRM